MDETVAVTTKYNYYRYYDMNRYVYKLNYEERKRTKELKEQEEKSNYYENYYKNWAKNHEKSFDDKVVT